MVKLDSTFPTDIISWREEDRSQPQNEIAEEPRLGVVEYFDPFERVQVDVEGDLRLEFVGEQAQRLLLVRWLLAEPEVVEPFDDAIL